MKKLLLACLLFSSYVHAQPMAELVKNINPGSADSGPKDFFTYNNLLVFTASTASNRGLWTSDGTDAGTTSLMASGSGGVNQLLAPALLNGDIIYKGTGSSGDELWKTNGTASGTVLISDINTTTATANSDPYGFTLFNGKIYFGADDGVHGPELWVTDGTTAGTQMLVDIEPGASGSTPSQFIVLNSKLFFTATITGHGTELWATDGTPGGTALFKELVAGPGGSNTSNFTLFNNKVYFYNNRGNELWVCNGTEAGTVLVKDLWPGNGTTVYGGMKECNGKLFLLATDANGRELWITDGTTAGTQMVKDIYTGSQPGVGSELYAYNDKIYFSGNDGTGTEPWSSDGTAAGTARVKAIYPATGSLPANFIMYDNKLFFTAVDATNGRQLWYTDGTDAGTKLVPVAGGAFANGALPYGAFLGVANGKLFFSASYSLTLGIELYCLASATASLQRVSALNDVIVYPNPAKEIITIQYTLTTTGSPQYRLYDMTGKCVATWYDMATLTGKQTKQLDISNLTPGMYQLQVEVNGKVQTMKIMKQ